MGKTEVKAYFDQLAPSWDAMEQKDDRIIEEILDHARIHRGVSVLDVACGTGILFPYYLDRGVSEITGLDLSDAMLSVARKKFPQPEIRLICGDAETFCPGCCYDRIMIHNAFPHFFHPEQLIAQLSTLLNPGGLLSVAHGMSRKEINHCHEGSARPVSVGLMPGEELAALFAKYLKVTACIDSERMYQVCGEK